MLKGNRKMVVAGVVTVVGVAISLYAGDVPNNLLTLLQVVLGAFVVGNTGEHFASILANSRAKGSVEEVENNAQPAYVGSDTLETLSKLSGDVEAANTKVDKANEALLVVQEALQFIVNTIRGNVQK